ncbi:MAG: Gfo/Idh/MocA family oxidoreductase [Woeseiaceae bacterium]|nr:Gfo/Idh/MocA family oxidoreductase [Woeseiaceae bacterium]
MSDKKLRWGVISTANIGRWAVNPAIQASGNGDLLAVASRDAKTAREFARQWNIPGAYGSYAELLDDEDIDAVYIPLPNSMHCEWTIKAAEAGKHVLCEKPLALTGDECHEMQNAARKNGVKLMEAFMYRFHPRIRRVLEMLRQGVVGDLKMIHAAFTFRLSSSNNIRWQPEFGGGALMDVGCYCINVSRTMVGAEPEEVQAFASWASTGVDEMMTGSLRFPGDILASFECGLNTKRRESCEIGGTEACLRIPDAFLPGTDDVVIEELRDGEEPVIHSIPGVDEYQCMVEHFADCVLHDRQPRYPADEAARNMRVIEALYESVRNGGRPVAVRSQSTARSEGKG